jgi:hypothetical protein
MSRSPRLGFNLFQLVAVLALLLILFALFLPAVLRAKLSAEARVKAMNNLHRLALALHEYHDAKQAFPPGLDDNTFSTAAQLLSFVGEEGLYKKIDFKKPIDDKANAESRKAVVKAFLSPRDPIRSVREEFGATNYLFNDLTFFLNSKTKITGIPDGTSNTIAIGETLKGDGGTKAVTVERQHVLLKKEQLQGLREDTGTGPWANDQNIVGDRCASWMDGRFLQGTFNGRLAPNDNRPDVSCESAGGVSALRSLDHLIPVAMFDGSSRFVNASRILHVTWKAAITPDGGEVLGSDF